MEGKPELEDLMAELALPAPEPKVKVRGRFTEWSDRKTVGESFIFGGYLARVLHSKCQCCEAESEVLIGVFMVEQHPPSGGRRLTPLARNGDWPSGEHPIEVVEGESRFCAECIRALGFCKEQPVPSGPTMEAGRGLVK